MKALIVLNGQYYAGENKDDNKLMFRPNKSEAVAVDDRRERFIIQNILRWFMNKEIKLQRLEILKVEG